MVVQAGGLTKADDFARQKIIVAKSEETKAG
jgi:hypothetical protein